MTDPADGPTDANWGAAGLPRLRIHHLLLATIVVATVTALYASLMQSRDSAPISYFIYVLGLAIPQAVAITTLALGIHWKRRGIGPFFDQPGNWLALIVVIEFALRTARPLYHAIVTSGIWPAPAFSFWMPMIVYTWLPRVFTGFVLLIAPRYICQKVAWRRFFIVAGAAQMFTTSFDVFGGWILVDLATSHQDLVKFAYVAVYAIADIGIPCLLFLGIRADRRLQTSRHWSHWCGVAAWLCVTATQGFSAIQDFVRNL